MKTRLALAELGIPYASHPIDLIETGRYENIRSRLLSVNPAGTVPVLLHEGHPVYESHEQIRYASRFSPDGVVSLVPTDAGERAEMEAWIDCSSLVGDPVAEPGRTAGNAIVGQTLPLFATMMERVPFPRLLEGFLFHFDRRRPLLFAVLKLRGVEGLPGIPPAVKAIRQSTHLLGGFLDRLESQLEKTGGPWILGSPFTLADVSWLVIFERMRQASCENVFLAADHRPLVAAYWDRLKARPSYREAILGHSHPLIEYGRNRIADAKLAHPRLRALLEGEPETEYPNKGRA